MDRAPRNGRRTHWISHESFRIRIYAMSIARITKIPFKSASYSDEPNAKILPNVANEASHG